MKTIFSIVVAWLLFAASPAQAALNHQALWWASPAGSESGWGLSITHQGDILFAVWYTYDTDGSAMWLVAPDARLNEAGSYTGLLYRTTGPAFNSVPFDPSAVGNSVVGNVELAFSDADNGRFFYTAYGVARFKPITRQAFGVVSTCEADGPTGMPNYQDLWWNSPPGSESGWGVGLAHQGDVLFATWFTYDSSGKGMWIVMPEGRLDGTSYSGKLYRTTGDPFNAVPWNPSHTVVTEVGAGSFNFPDIDHGTFSYTVNGISQTKAITRQVFSTPATVCR